MTSERKVAANRSNGRKSRGPRSAAGKSRASRNAFRHGLSTISRDNATLSRDIERMAKAICGEDDHPLLFEQAIIVAENELTLRCVRAEYVATIERLRDPIAVPVTKIAHVTAVLENRNEQARRAWDELVQIWARFGVGEIPPAPAEVLRIMEALENEPARGWWPPIAVLRDEVDAWVWAMPDLDRLKRYQRRSWSRLRRALNRIIELKFKMATS